MGRVVEGSFSSAGAAWFAGVVGCDSTEVAGPRPLAEGSAMPGFVVARAEPGSELALVGRHRYSEYALVFRMVDDGGTTRLRAETRARFRAAPVGSTGLP